MIVYLHTFGCKANQYDTELVRQALEDAGATTADDPADADAAVINSCTVTHTGEAKLRALVRRIARERPDIRTVIMGCAAALDDGTLSRLPNVTSVVSGSNPVEVMRALDLNGPVPETLLRSFTSGSRAWLRIQDGCDEHCTFCATTVARGPNRSRPVMEIVREAGFLAQSHAEIVLTGIHIGTYRDDPDDTSLSGLVRTLVERVPDVRFRLSSVEATEIDEHLAYLLINAGERLASHIHAPLQSGSDRVLKRMGRHWYTSDAYRARIEWLAERLPVFGLGADVMVGFPGETDGDHRETVELVSDLPFTYLHVFPYSERPVASALRLGPPVDPRTVAERSAELRKLAEGKKERYLKTRDGGEADVVMISRRGGRAEGVTEDFLTVGFDSELGLGRRFAASVYLRNGDLVAEPATALV